MNPKKECMGLKWINAETVKDHVRVIKKHGKVIIEGVLRITDVYNEIPQGIGKVTITIEGPPAQTIISSTGGDPDAMMSGKKLKIALLSETSWIRKGPVLRWFLGR